MVMWKKIYSRRWHIPYMECGPSGKARGAPGYRFVSFYGLGNLIGWRGGGIFQLLWGRSGNFQELGHCPLSLFSLVQLSCSSCLTLCDPMNHSTPGLPVHHQLPEFTQTHVHWVGDAIQPSHPLLSPSPPAPNTSQHQGLFQWVNSSHQVARVLEFQLQHQSFQWTPRTDVL